MLWCQQQRGLSMKGSRARGAYPVVEIIKEAQDVVLVGRVVAVDVLEQLHFVQALVEEVLVVLDDLQAHVHPRVQVVRLDRLAERR